MKSGGKNKWLVGVLVVLAIVIVGLVVGVVVININNGAQDEQEQTEDGVDEYIEVATKDEVYVLSEELAKAYYEGDTAKAMREYKANMDIALSEEDYNKFFRLLSGVSNTMVDNGDCAQLMAFYDGIDENKLPVDQKVYYYGTVASFCESCGDSARQALYETKAQQLYDSGEIENYEN